MPIAFTYNIKSRRYRETSSGRFISQGAVRASVDAVIDSQVETIRAVSSKLVSGEINLAEWQLQTAKIVKTTHVALALAGNGGIQNTSNADLGYIGNKVKAQYQYLRSFAKQIKSGGQPLDGTLVARSALYVQSARGTFEAIATRAATNGGATEEQSVLGPADSCDLCKQEAAKGWSPINSLIPIGQRTCGPNCRCTLNFR